MNQEEIEKVLIVWSKQVRTWIIELRYMDGEVGYDYMHHGGFNNLIVKAREKYEDALSAGAVLKIEATPEQLGIYVRP